MSVTTSRKWVQEDYLEDNPELATTFSVQWPQFRRNVSAVDDPGAKKGKGKGQGQAHVGEGSGKTQGSNTVRQAGHPDVVRKPPLRL